MNKATTLLLILILATSSLMIVESGDAQSIPKPSVPEFTLTYTDNPYDVSPRTSVDSFSGEITQYPGYHVKNGSLELVIKNQQYNSYYDSNGHLIKLYYHIRMKDYSATEWKYSNDLTAEYFPASDSDYMTCYYIVEENFVVGKLYVPSGKVDFAVEAFLGYSTKVITGGDPIVTRPGDYHYEFYGETSGWSPTHTVTIGNPLTSTISTASPTPAPTPTITPTQTMTATNTQEPSASPVQPNTGVGFVLGLSFEQIIIIALSAVIVALVVVLVFSSQRKVSSKSGDS